MFLDVTSGTVRSLQAAWRPLIALVAAGAVVLGPVLQLVAATIAPGGATTGTLPTVLGLVVLLAGSVLLVGAAVVVCGGSGRVTGIGTRQLTAVMRARAARLLAYAACAAAIPMLALVLLLAAATIHPLLGLLLVLPAYVVAAFAAPVVLLSIAAGVSGDSTGWTPAAAVAACRSRWLALTGTCMALFTAIPFVSLPALVAGVVVSTMPQPLGALGAGFALAVPLVVVGCAARALWHAVGPPGGRGVAVGMRALAHWELALEPGVAWGQWLQVDVAGPALVQLGWRSGPAPRLSTYREDAGWTTPLPPRHVGDHVVVELALGNCWIQLDPQCAHVQHVVVDLLRDDLATQLAA